MRRRSVPESAEGAPIVSVAMITFNQERFIEQAVESVLAQRVDFPIEVIVGDDFSTDRTRELLGALQSRHPQQLNVILRPANLGMTRNYFDVLSRCRGKYIALLEGDDYWTDPEKLARQVAVMESHPNVDMCHHNANSLDESSGRLTPFHEKPLPAFLSGGSLLKGNPAATCTVMYRRKVTTFPEWLHRCPLGDWTSHLLHALDGKVAYLDRLMGVYRLHAGGIWSGQSQRRNLEGRITTTRIVQEELPAEYREELGRTIERLVNHSAEYLVRDGQEQEAAEYVRSQNVSTAGLERLEQFYRGLKLEESGQRLAALRHFARAAQVGRGVTRITNGDIAIAASRTMSPRLYGAVRGLVRKQKSG